MPPPRRVPARQDLRVQPPKTRYVQADGLNIAYQVGGDGPFDLVYVPGFVSNVELSWEEPLSAWFLERLASFSRLVLFDKRGTGMSDRVPPDDLPSLEERMDDLTAVLDAVGSDEVALFSHSEGGNLAVLFAATYPERTRALITAGIFAKRVWSEDYPWAPTPGQRARATEQVEADRGGTSWLVDLVPSCADGRDANIEEGRWIAAQIPGARFIELPCDDHIPWAGDAEGVLDLVEEFLTGGVQGPGDLERVLASVLFHHRHCRFDEDGSGSWRTGDGALATFDGPARSVRCACALRDAVGHGDLPPGRRPHRRDRTTRRRCRGDRGAYCRPGAIPGTAGPSPSLAHGYGLGVRFGARVR